MKRIDHLYVARTHLRDAIDAFDEFAPSQHRDASEKLARSKLWDAFKILGELNDREWKLASGKNA